MIYCANVSRRQTLNSQVCMNDGFDTSLGDFVTETWEHCKDNMDHSKDLGRHRHQN